SSPVGFGDGSVSFQQPREGMLRALNAFTESWVVQHRAKSLSEVVALGQQVRAETLTLLAELTDAQLLEKLPGAPWPDGTTGARGRGAHAGGGAGRRAAPPRRHWGWVQEGWAAAR